MNQAMENPDPKVPPKPISVWAHASPCKRNESKWDGSNRHGPKVRGNMGSWKKRPATSHSIFEIKSHASENPAVENEGWYTPIWWNHTPGKVIRGRATILDRKYRQDHHPPTKRFFSCSRSQFTCDPTLARWCNLFDPKHQSQRPF